MDTGFGVEFVLPKLTCYSWRVHSSPFPLAILTIWSQDDCPSRLRAVGCPFLGRWNLGPWRSEACAPHLGLVCRQHEVRLISMSGL